MPQTLIDNENILVGTLHPKTKPLSTFLEENDGPFKKSWNDAFHIL